MELAVSCDMRTRSRFPFSSSRLTDCLAAPTHTSTPRSTYSACPCLGRKWQGVSPAERKAGTRSLPPLRPNNQAEPKSKRTKTTSPRSYQAHDRLAAGALGALTKHLSPLAAHHRSQIHSSWPRSSIAACLWESPFLFLPSRREYLLTVCRTPSIK